MGTRSFLIAIYSNITNSHTSPHIFFKCAFSYRFHKVSSNRTVVSILFWDWIHSTRLNLLKTLRSLLAYILIHFV